MGNLPSFVVPVMLLALLFALMGRSKGESFKSREKGNDATLTGVAVLLIISVLIMLVVGGMVR